MLVVSDTSAITNLAAIKQLGLLQALFTEIVIPEAVERELVAPGTSNPGAIEVLTESSILVRPVADRSLSAQLLSEYESLDASEAEAIVVAIEIKADLLLIDE